MSHPSLKRFSSGYEDPFAVDMMNQFEPVPQDQTVPETSSIDRDNKLLGFSMPIYNFTLLDYSLRRTHLTMSAQLHGMFFLAESPWASAGEAAPPPAELTCYRRNLFQITGSIILPRALRYIMTDQGDRIPILAQELTISATESVEGNPVKIISVPWKTPAANTTAVVEDKIEKEPPSIPLDTMSGQDMDSDYATFPIAWKRLQFRIATANNGRRKELQQHFVVRLKVVATLSTGAKIPICEALSGAIIVRGRSPRNFQSRKDFPLSGGAGATRKNMQSPQALTRTSTGDSAPQQPAPQKQEKTPPDLPQMIFQYDDHSLQKTSPTFPDWTAMPQPNSGTLPTPTFANTAIPAPMPAYAQSGPEISRPVDRNSISPHAPINLSLTDDEPSKPPQQQLPLKSPNSLSTTTEPRSSTLGPTSAPSTKSQKPRLSHHPSSSSAAAIAVPPLPTSTSIQSDNTNTFSSPGDESADLLYEYFPLGLDDWMPPVDAVYRPHVVHHTNMPVDPKAVAVRNRSKRYFSEDMG